MNLHIISWSNFMMQTCKKFNTNYIRIHSYHSISRLRHLWTHLRFCPSTNYLGAMIFDKVASKIKMEDKNNTMHHKKTCLLQRSSATFCALTFLRIISSTTACMYLHRIVMVWENLDPQKYIDSFENKLIQNMCIYKEMNFHYVQWSPMKNPVHWSNRGK